MDPPWHGVKLFFNAKAWKEVDNCVSDFLRGDSQPNTLEWIGFSFSSPQQTKQFADEIVGPHMPCISISVAKIRYGVIVRGQNGKSEVRPVTLEGTCLL